MRRLVLVKVEETLYFVFVLLEIPYMLLAMTRQLIVECLRMNRNFLGERITMHRPTIHNWVVIATPGVGNKLQRVMMGS